MKLILLTAALLATSAASAETYTIDTEKSHIDWKAGKKIGSFHNGKIQIKNGKVETDKKGQVSKAEIAVDMSTITNEDLKDSPEYQTKLVGHLSSEDFFHVEKYPESTFKLKSIKLKPGSKDQYLVKGDLTMIGVTKPVEFPAEISADKNKLEGSATLTIERLKWGLKYGSGSIFKSLTADKIINDSFELKLNLVAKK
ncbi:MAG TPA: YceI family protein [Bdellovibrionales bacterium]|nr:YCE I like family protein [Pseudobdellovibrionaceae bacterium]HAG90441.1 YceI family protein [Bdellovibrionales bacterium]